MNKRLHILERPTPVSDLKDFDDDYDTGWTQKAERVRLRRWRRVKQQLA